MLTLECSFGDNYSPTAYTISWNFTLENGSHFTVREGVNYTGYHMNTYQDCRPSCCQFKAELFINATTPSLNNATVTCNAKKFEEQVHGVSNLSKLMCMHFVKLMCIIH